MSRKFRILALVFIVLEAGVGPAGAQPPVLRDTPVDSGAQKPPYIIVIDGVEKAQRLMELGEFGRAADLLQSLLDKSPESMVVKDLLATCLEQSKDYNRLLLFLKRRLQTDPPSFALYRDLGQAYILAGSPDSVDQAFYQAFAQSVDRERAGSALAGIYHRFGLYSQESRFIDSVRVIIGNSQLWADQQGDALAAQRRFAAATSEYLAHMEKDSLAAKDAEDKLISLMRFPESADTVMAILSERITSRTDNMRLQNIYGQLLMEQNKYAEAFEFFRRLDSLHAGNGSDLLYFMRESLKRRQYDQVLTAGNYFLATHQQSPMRNSIQFAIAEALVETGRYREALAAYETVAGDFIRPAHRAEANLAIAMLYKDHLDDPAKAKEYFTEVIRAVPGGSYALSAQMGLADVAIKDRRFDSAVSLYTTVLGQDLPPETAEQIEFTLAEIYLFQGDYKESTARFKQIISRYPRGFYVNDAIQYSLIIGEAQDEAPQQMDLFAASEYYRHTGREDSLEYYLTKICRVGISALAPISYLHLAEMYADQNRYEEAVTSVDSLASLFPESYYLPYGLKLKADIYLQSPVTREEALAMYRDLLQNYSTYPFAAEIRNIVRRETPSGHS